ncbi:pyruvate formate lyase-activating protein [Romboutsia weinsteinii]|uniref:Pyruvate formate-lyase-activating enzyme n=1 Tax=Romboutsia weinsteinii TaxID=2020949 RepID=A0A371J8Z9_9FIRM|nr:pyruvate formate-lyase-activating protein [Romboutsia weinsteinii]RDY29215.1 pyruvate formate lyase-activating protein [Romboutsia weinsteinii]
MVKGRVHSIETFGTVDGPGIRFILFLQGCPLRCKYCHNRDTWDTKAGTEYTTDEVITQALKYSSYMKFSGGGITASGGEATLQPEFLTELFAKAKKNGIHTCLDTSGFVNIDTVDPILDNTDLVLLDIKHMVDEKSKDLTGVSIEKTLKLAKHLDERNIPVWIRHVLVPGVTDDVENLEKLAEFVSTLNNVDRFEILPYHTIGVHKWESMNLNYELKDVPDCTIEDVDRAIDIMSKYDVEIFNKKSA